MYKLNFYLNVAKNQVPISFNVKLCGGRLPITKFFKLCGGRLPITKFFKLCGEDEVPTSSNLLIIFFILISVICGLFKF